jgi:hypothetical protein
LWGDLTVRRSDDRICLFTRLSALAITVVLGGGATLLLGWPTQTQELWAWTIRPPMTALAVGAGFASGVYFFGRATLARQWHTVSLGFGPVWLFTCMTAAATLIHIQSFNPANITFWVWTGVYAVTPVLLPVVWLLNRSADPRVSEANEPDLPIVIRRSLALVGGAGLVLAAIMFIQPTLAASFWPWALTPLAARIESAWVALAGALGVVVARESRWSAIAPALRTGCIAAWLTLMGIARSWADFDPYSLATWMYVAYIATPALCLPILDLVMSRRSRGRERRIAPPVLEPSRA